MTESFTVYRKVYDPSDPRLGRHVRHDSRSLSYAIEAEDISALKSVTHVRHIPTLDQGNLGSCTGNAAAGCLGTGQFWSTAQAAKVLSASDATEDEKYAVKVYSAATGLDPYPGTYPPTDTGSDGLSVAKVLQAWKLISGYQHALSLEAFLTALSKQPVICGTEWRSDMFNPAPDGKISITGSVEGGHEYVFDELDVENKRVWMHNSWGDGWGVHGRAYFTWDDFGKLLAADGDCTVFTPIEQPAPQPTPPAPPQPTPPTPPSPDDPAAQFLAAARAFNDAWVHAMNTGPAPS